MVTVNITVEAERLWRLFKGLEQVYSCRFICISVEPCKDTLIHSKNICWTQTMPDIMVCAEHINEQDNQWHLHFTSENRQLWNNPVWGVLLSKKRSGKASCLKRKTEPARWGALEERQAKRTWAGEWLGVSEGKEASSRWEKGNDVGCAWRGSLKPKKEFAFRLHGGLISVQSGWQKGAVDQA